MRYFALIAAVTLMFGGCATTKKAVTSEDLVPYAKKDDVDAKMRMWGGTILSQAKKASREQIRSFERDCGCLSEMK